MSVYQIKMVPADAPEKGRKEYADTAPQRGDKLSSEDMLVLYLFPLCLDLSLSRSHVASLPPLEPCVSPAPCHG